MADKDINKNPNPAAPAESAIAVKRSGQRTAKLQQRIKVTKWVVISLLLLVIILYLLFLFFWQGGGSSSGDDYGDFTVMISEGQRNLITLSESVNFDNASFYLKGSSVNDLWHCTRSCIPEDIQDRSDGGSHHATYNVNMDADAVILETQPTQDQDVPCEPSYFAYTYFLKNLSDEEIEYTYDFVLVDNLKNGEVDALDAIRVMIIKNGEKVVWAKDTINGVPIEDNTEIFNVEPQLIEITDNPIQAGDIDKYTVVMWLEGWDPECVNDIFLNTLKFEMNFKVQNKVKNDTSETSEN